MAKDDRMFEARPPSPSGEGTRVRYRLRAAKLKEFNA